MRPFLQLVVGLLIGMAGGAGLFLAGYLYGKHSAGNLTLPAALSAVVPSRQMTDQDLLDAFDRAGLPYEVRARFVRDDGTGYLTIGVKDDWTANQVTINVFRSPEEANAFGRENRIAPDRGFAWRRFFFRGSPDFLPRVKTALP